MSEILFRVDGGKVWGLSFGHVYRCLELARELDQLGTFSLRFLMKEYPEGVQLVRDAGYPVATLPVESSPADEVAAMLGAPERTIVVDRHDADRLAMEPLLAQGRQVVVIDDLGHKTLCVSKVVNGSIVPDVWHYGPCPDGAPDLFTGPDYFVLSPLYDDIVAKPVPARAASVLVTFGGSDPRGLTMSVAKSIAADPPPMTFDFVIGPGYGDGRELADTLAPLAERVRLHRSLPELRSALLAADLVVCAGGRTALEAARVGTPAILIPSIEHEVPVANRLADAGCAIDLGMWNGEPTSRGLARALDELMVSVERRDGMGRAGRSLIDGRGRRRVAALIAESSARET
ncbi:PseG/SpsG family protein [Endothiovibrio diazotrophicus]